MKITRYNTQNVFTSKVVCVGRNYVEHIKELGNETPESIVLFNKPNSAISDELYYFSEDTRFEAEICFLIRDKKIAGVGFGLDLTKANVQSYLKSKSLPWERAKAFDNSAVISEFVAFEGDITKLSLVLYINDKLTQEATYNLMIHKPQDILNEIESFMSLEDNDIIMSGTPKGVSNYSVGDTFVGKVFCGAELLVEQEWIVKTCN
ncbi:fumarylacetoacetate hydrolase family protein [Sulfurimonas sp. CS5]|uniref:fumarylacetoacetate hydrolase family protein n=1 Tax=Sulfurimonas sp. CS5 TaxID=3391145 RepID=UPI0039EC25E7